MCTWTAGVHSGRRLAACSAAAQPGCGVCGRGAAICNSWRHPGGVTCIRCSKVPTFGATHCCHWAPCDLVQFVLWLVAHARGMVRSPLIGQEHSRCVGRPFSQVRSSRSVSLAYSQRPAAHAIVDLRNVPGFVPDSRWFSIAGCTACPAVLVWLKQRHHRCMSLV